MEFEKLFKVVVVGGSMLAGGCAPKTPAAAVPEVSIKMTSKDGTDCTEVCERWDPSERESFCPDSVMDVQNCCWLMVARHECCP